MEKNSENIDFSSLSHVELKNLGNKLFELSKYNQAIRCYTHAINAQPNISTYYSNRALCYMMLQENNNALFDCRRSIELDRNNLKAHFFAGHVYLGLQQYDEALSHLIHSHNLALEQHCNYGDAITSAIRFVKKKRYEVMDERRRNSEIALQIYLNNLIMEDSYRQKMAVIQNSDQKLLNSTISGTASMKQTDIESKDSDAKSGTSQALFNNKASDLQSTTTRIQNSLPPASNIDLKENFENLSPETQQKFTDIDVMANRRLTELNELFAQVDERRQKRDIPDYLCGRISFELMHEPVITPSGITYDKRSITSHLRRVGHFDPLSRQPLTEDQLIPNLVMKEVVNAFLENNPWAESC